MDRITALALRAKAGDRRALEQFFSAVHDDIHQLCRYLGRPTDPDDLVQETFERSLRSLHRFRAEGSALSWILSISRRVCADSTRRAMRSRRLDQRITAEPAAGEHHRDASWVEVDELLSVLDEDRREAFVLTQILGLSYEDAARAIGCPIGTIRSRVARARRQLITDDGVDAALLA